MIKVDPIFLKNLLEAVVTNALFQPRFLEKYGLVTQCNRGLHLIARVFGLELTGTANRIIEYLHTSPLWRQIDMYDAHKFACQGALVVAEEKGLIHGHVVVVAPGDQVWSGKWSCDVPLGGNVGGQNWYPLRGLNWSFKHVPNIYVYDPEPSISQDDLESVATTDYPAKAGSWV